MRVVVKPAGLLLIIAMIGVLATLAFVRERPASTASASAPLSGSGTAKSDTVNLLKNPSFEGPVSPPPILDKSAKAKVTGKLGDGWLENSNWANVKLEYAIDPNNPHDGKNSQRIKLVALQEGQAQFVQETPVKQGSIYRATIWARASEENTPVEFVLREAGDPYTQYGDVTASVGLQWQQIAVRGKVTRPGNLFVMTIFHSPGASLWLDDASLTEAK